MVHALDDVTERCTVASCRCCDVRDSPNSEKIMEILLEAREMFAETPDQEKFPLPPYAYDMRPDVEFPKRS
jgi:hypothetical protein